VPIIFQGAPASACARLLCSHFLMPDTDFLFVPQLRPLADYLLESSIVRGGRPVSFSIPLVHMQGSIFPPLPLVVAQSPCRWLRSSSSAQPRIHFLSISPSVLLVAGCCRSWALLAVAQDLGFPTALFYCCCSSFCSHLLSVIFSDWCEFLQVVF
jgi:hypothetical protein